MEQANRSPRALSGLTVLALTTLAASNLLRGIGKPARSRREAAVQPSTRPIEVGGTVASGNGAAEPVDHLPGIFGLCRSIFDRFNRDNASQTAAGIAFYLFVSIFPGLAVLVSIYGLIGDPANVGQQIAPFASLLPPEAMKLLNDGLAGFIKTSGESHVSVALATSLALALWSARNAMASIMVGLNIAYEEIERRSFIVTTLISLALTLGAIVFAVVAVGAVAVVPAVLSFFYLGAFVENLLFYGRWPLLAATVVLGFAVLYRFAPDRSHARWRWITWGSGIATILWLSGSVLFSFYVSHFSSYDATYGSLGAVVVLLLWFWVSSLVMVLGAEIDAELDVRATKTGSPTGGTPPSSGPPVGR